MITKEKFLLEYHLMFGETHGFTELKEDSMKAWEVIQQIQAGDEIKSAVAVIEIPHRWVTVDDINKLMKDEEVT